MYGQHKLNVFRAKPKLLAHFHAQKWVRLSKHKGSTEKLGYNLNGPWVHFGPGHFLVPEKFAPREIWSPWNLAPQKLAPAWKYYVTIFMQGPNFFGPKLLRAQISWGQNFMGTNLFWDQKSQGPKWGLKPFQLKLKIRFPFLSIQ